MQPENNMVNNQAGMVGSNVSMPTSMAGADKAPETKETKEKMSKKNIIGLVILSLIAVGGVLFGVYGMNSQNEKVAELTVRATNAEGKVAELETEKVTITEPSGEKVEIVDSANAMVDIWSNFSSGLMNQRVNIMGYYWHYNGSENEQYVAYAMKDNNGHLTITDAGNNMNTTNPVILELDNVLMMYYIKVGNGGVPYFYIVDVDGAVNRVDISENSNRQLEKVGDYTKIATVLEVAGSEAILVDINGNIYRSF